MKKFKFSKIAVVIIVVIVLYFLYEKKRKTQLPPVSLPWPDKPGGSGGGGGGYTPVDPKRPVKIDPIIPSPIPSPIPRVKFKPPVPLGIDAIQPPEPTWRAKRISNSTDQTLNVAIGTGFKFGTSPPTGDMTTINHLYNGSGKRSKIYDVSPYITWP